MSGRKSSSKAEVKRGKTGISDGVDLEIARVVISGLRLFLLRASVRLITGDLIALLIVFIMKVRD